MFLLYIRYRLERLPGFSSIDFHSEINPFAFIDFPGIPRIR
jgi:hypothetical protein